MSTLARITRVVKRRGVGGLTRLALSRLMSLAYLRERHVWYWLDLVGARERHALPVGWTLRRGTAADLPLLRQLPTIGQRQAEERLRVGARLWLLFEGLDLVFAAWTIDQRVPTIAARGGWMDLPAHVAALEDSVSDPSRRGKGLAQIGWLAIADALERDGIVAITSKVEAANTACRTGMEKIGFRPVAAMQFARIAGHGHVQLELQGAGPIGTWLTERLVR